MMRTMNSITTHTYTMNRKVRSITRSTVRERTVRRVRLHHHPVRDQFVRPGTQGTPTNSTQELSTHFFFFFIKKLLIFNFVRASLFQSRWRITSKNAAVESSVSALSRYTCSAEVLYRVKKLSPPKTILVFPWFQHPLNKLLRATVSAFLHYCSTFSIPFDHQ